MTSGTRPRSMLREASHQIIAGGSADAGMLYPDAATRGHSHTEGEHQNTELLSLMSDRSEMDAQKSCRCSQTEQLLVVYKLQEFQRKVLFLTFSLNVSLYINNDEGLLLLFLAAELPFISSSRPPCLSAPAPQVLTYRLLQVSMTPLHPQIHIMTQQFPPVDGLPKTSVHTAKRSVERGPHRAPALQRQKRVQEEKHNQDLLSSEESIRLNPRPVDGPGHVSWVEVSLSPLPQQDHQDRLSTGLHCPQGADRPIYNRR
ncbi:hypothetical protein FQA47_007160 [Oryzias melastigma]|uniref:Uncharacterized protein n=1 Tax=Oryzias melastigma TaxID=30732 RepID=A0A834BQF3_ORYME|nr:hypothetical protein FQA47_007160 [Oryzias melastigma]